MAENETFEPTQNGSTTNQIASPYVVSPIMLAWQYAFRTFDWQEAVGDLNTNAIEINHLLSLV